MSINIENIEAYNVKLKKKEKMRVTAVIKTPIMKEGVATGKFRFRLAGVGSDGTGMSRFVKEDDAKSAAQQLGQSIEKRDAKPSAGAKRRTCKQIGMDAEQRCVERRSVKKKVAAEPKFVEEKVSPPKEKAAPKKKAAAPKKKAACPKEKAVPKKKAACPKEKAAPKKKKATSKK